MGSWGIIIRYVLWVNPRKCIGNAIGRYNFGGSPSVFNSSTGGLQDISVPSGCLTWMEHCLFFSWFFMIYLLLKMVIFQFRLNHQRRKPKFCRSFRWEVSNRSWTEPVQCQRAPGPMFFDACCILGSEMFHHILSCLIMFYDVLAIKNGRNMR